MHTYSSVAVSCMLTCSSSLFDRLSGCCTCLQLACFLAIIHHIMNFLLLPHVDQDLLPFVTIDIIILTLDITADGSDIAIIFNALQSQLQLVSQPGHRVRANRQILVGDTESTWKPLVEEYHARSNLSSQYASDTCLFTYRGFSQS